LFSLFACLLPLFWYLHALSKNSEILKAKGGFSAFIDLFSHIGRVEANAWGHVLPGVSIVTGTCGLLTAIVISGLSETENISLALSVFSALTVVFFLIFELWVLWQTRRLAFKEGYVIYDFHTLIERITEELEKMNRDIRDKHYSDPKQFHRLYICAPHFFFGILSFPGTHLTTKYLNALKQTCVLAKEVHDKHEASFPVKIICGDKDVISNWHEGFVPKSDNAERASLLDELTNEHEKHLKAMASPLELNLSETSSFSSRKYASGKTFKHRLIRAHEKAKVQFMIIGNTLFEFTMNSENSSTNIYDTQVIHDQRTINAYVNQFNFIAKLVDKSVTD